MPAIVIDACRNRLNPSIGAQTNLDGSVVLFNQVIEVL